MESKMVCVFCNNERNSEVVVSKKGVAVCIACEEVLPNLIVEELKQYDEMVLTCIFCGSNEECKEKTPTMAFCKACDDAISSVLEDMKREEETKGEHKMKLELTYMNHKGIAAFIAENESKTYEGKNGDGERLTATVEQGVRMTVHTYQQNGKIRVNTYNKEGFQTNETFKEM